MHRTWHASFITPTTSTGAPNDPAPYLRREITVADGLRRATLHVTALGLVEPWVNGTRVGDEVLAPGWTSYRHRLAVVDLRRDRPARRRVPTPSARCVGEGWAVGRLGWENRRHHYDRPAAPCSPSSSSSTPTAPRVVATDTRSGGPAPADQLADAIYDGETFDARLEPPGWSTAGFDDAAWAPVETVRLGPRPRSSSRRRRRSGGSRSSRRSRSSPRRRGAPSSTSGRTSPGGSGSRWTAPAGDHRHAPPRRDPAPTASSTARRSAPPRPPTAYTLRGGGPETWEPRFTFHGFRYVEVDGWPGELTPRPSAPSSCTATCPAPAGSRRRTTWSTACTRTPCGRCGTTSSACRPTARSATSASAGPATSTPSRPTAAFLYDVRGVLGSWLEDLAAEQRSKGYVPWVVPDVLPTPSSPTALWSDVAVSLPWALYQEYGDLEILRRALPLDDRRSSDDVEPTGSTSTGCGAPGSSTATGSTPTRPPTTPRAARPTATWSPPRTSCRIAAAELADRRAVSAARDDADALTAPWPTASGPPSAPSTSRAAGRVVERVGDRLRAGDLFDLLDPEQRAARRGPARGARRAGGVHHLDRVRRHPAGHRRALSSTGHLDGGVPAAPADALPVVPLPGHHGRDDDLGALGLRPPRRHRQPVRDDVAQPLRARRRGRLAAPHRRRPEPPPSRVGGASASPRSRAAGSPTPASARHRSRAAPRCAGGSRTGRCRSTSSSRTAPRPRWSSRCTPRRRRSPSARAPTLAYALPGTGVGRPEHTMDTLLGVLATDPATWRRAAGRVRQAPARHPDRRQRPRGRRHLPRPRARLHPRRIRRAPRRPGRAPSASTTDRKDAA